MLPPNHMRGGTPIDAVYGTSGILCTAVALLPSQVGVGNHRVFLLVISLETILRDIFPHVILIASCLLNCASDKIRKNYILVLNQLANRHLVFKKLLRIDKDSDHITPAQVQLRMNRVSIKLEQFMKSAKANSHKYKRNNIEWPPYPGVWINQRWLLVRVQTYLAGKMMDPRNLLLGVPQAQREESLPDF
jgi:hypothetical protein